MLFLRYLLMTAGVGMILEQKQTMRCLFKPVGGGTPEPYLGRIDEFGLAIGTVGQGHLVWGVVAPASGVPHGALSGSYFGVGAQASLGVGAGANVLVGGTGRAFSLQPISVEGELGLNVAGGVTIRKDKRAENHKPVVGIDIPLPGGPTVPAMRGDPQDRPRPWHCHLA